MNAGKDKRRIGPFELERQLGSGGMGIVYLATYLKTGQEVALKVLTPALSADDKLLARFEREMGILRKLKHPNIIRYYGGGKHENQHFYAMEVMDGGSLEQVLRKKGQLSWEQVIDVGRQICAALEHAHNAGIIHRDLKPGNLFLTKKGRLKLGDFGIARDTEATALTAAGKTVGTYSYMAPEQISGRQPISKKTDLYALGCVLFQALTGRAPFEAETAAEMLFKHLEDDPPDVREFALDCPIWLDELVGRLLEKDPEDRPYDALAVHTELGEVRHKVTDQVSVVQQTLSGATTKGATVDITELKKALGKKKKKKKKKNVPFYERTSVLSSVLLLVIGLVTWAAWPLSEDELYARAKGPMETQSPDKWRQAREDYIDDYLERFPDGKYAKEMRVYIDRIEMEKTERQVMKRIERGAEPRTEAERVFMAAYKYEQFGDRVTAMENYHSMVELFADRDEDRPFVNLARRQIARIEQSGSDPNDRLRIVNNSVKEADRLFASGNVVEAQKKWRSIETLYAGNREFTPQVEYVRARLSGDEVEPFDFDATQLEAESTDDSFGNYEH